MTCSLRKILFAAGTTLSLFAITSAGAWGAGDVLDGLRPVGKGAHGRAFVLRDPLDGAVLANTPYRLFLNGKGACLRHMPNGACALEDKTDALGRTAWVRSDNPVGEADISLVRRVGSGRWGRLVSFASGNDAPASKHRAVLTQTTHRGTRWIDIGYADDAGHIAWVASEMALAPVNVMQYFDAATHARLYAIVRLFHHEGAPAGIAALESFARTARHETLLGASHLALMLGREDLARNILDASRLQPLPAEHPERLLMLRINLARLLGNADSMIADTNALRSVASTRHRPGNAQLGTALAYYLADHDAFLPRALDEVRRVIREHGADPYNTSTLGWILVRMGNHEDGLSLLSEAYKDLSTHEEAVADYGRALLMARRNEHASGVWKRAISACVWGPRLERVLRENNVQHPLLLPPDAPETVAFLQKCRKRLPVP